MATDCIFHDYSHCGRSVRTCGSFFSFSIEKNKIPPSGNVSCVATLRQENIKNDEDKKLKLDVDKKKRISETDWPPFHST